MNQSKRKSINKNVNTVSKYLDMIFLLILISKSGLLKLIQILVLKRRVDC